MPARLHPILLCPLLMALSGCEILYASKLNEAEHDCERLVMQSAVKDCKQKITAQQTAFRRSLADKGKAEGPPAKSDLCYARQTTGERVCPN